jgi:hypothetical protein
MSNPIEEFIEERKARTERNGQNAALLDAANNFNVESNRS